MGLRPASRVRPEESSDGQERPGRRPRFLPESLATEHDYGSPMSPGAASHRGPGTVPVQQTQQASSPHAPAGSAGGEGESLVMQSLWHLQLDQLWNRSCRT